MLKQLFKNLRNVYKLITLHLFIRLSRIIFNLVIKIKLNQLRTDQMRRKRNSLDHDKYSTIQGQSQQFQKTHQLSKTLPQNLIQQNKTNSSQQVQPQSPSRQIQHKSNRIINNNLISSLNPKRTSMDLSSFIQVFRKKVRQSTIAKQFQNSLEKFTSLSCNRTISYNRQKGGFVGAHKKQNQLLVQNNKIDNKIKKIIISDLEYKDRKQNTKSKLNYGAMEILLSKKQSSFEESRGQKSSKFSRRKMLTYANDQNEDPYNNTTYFSNTQLDTQVRPNPESLELNQTSNFHPERQKLNTQSSNKSSSIFSNRRLQTITSYQRPNMMYNLSLYRKKHSYNVLRKSKKKIITTNQMEKNGQE